MVLQELKTFLIKYIFDHLIVIAYAIEQGCGVGAGVGVGVAWSHDETGVGVGVDQTASIPTPERFV